MKKCLRLAVFAALCGGAGQAQTGEWHFLSCTERIGTVLSNSPNDVFSVRRENLGASLDLDWSNRTLLIKDARGVQIGATALSAQRSGNVLVVHAYVATGQFRGSSVMGLLTPVGNNNKLWRAKLTMLPLPYLQNGAPVALYELNC